jgi:nucleoside-diphosphate-sugar epimerase
MLLNKVIASDIWFITESDLPWERFRGKTFLISGAAGFLPAYMVETLLHLNDARGFDIKVIALVRNLERALKRFSHHKDNQSLIFLSQDVCDEVKFPGDIDYIIHAASQATPKVFSKDPVGTILPNVVGTRNLLELAAEKKVECFLFFSTSGVYGHVDESRYPIKEDCFGYLNSTDLASCYLESKRMGENLCVAWMHQYGVPVKIVRPAITFGPGIKLDDGRSAADFVSKIINCQDIELYTDGKALRNYCYIADATIGFFTIMIKGNPGEAYNIASDQDISIIKLARLLVKKVFPERHLKVLVKPDVSRNFFRIPFSRTTLNISKAKALGWKLNFQLEEGFKRTVESIALDISSSKSLLHKSPSLWHNLRMRAHARSRN